MQNPIVNRPTLSDRVATVYQEMLSALPVINGQLVYPQMPMTQLSYFSQQAITRHYLVQLQFKAATNVAPTTVVGHLQQDAFGHLILKQTNQVTTIVTLELLRSIQRC